MNLELYPQGEVDYRCKDCGFKWTGDYFDEKCEHCDSTNIEERE